MIAADRPRGTPDELRVLVLATLVTCALGWLFKAHCSFDGGWNGNEQYLTGCYSDAVPFWSGRGVAAGEVPYFQARMEYPVLTGAAIWIEGVLTRLLFGARASALDFLTIVTAVNAALAILVLKLLAGMGLPRARLWLWPAAPPLLLYVGHNWDLVTIVFAVAALALARRGKTIGAAAMAGAGVAAKLFPVVMLPLLVLRALLDRRIGRVVLAALAAIAAWALLNAPAAIGAFHNWAEFYTFSKTRTGTAASFWELAGHYGWLSTTTPERNLYAALLFAAGAAAIIAAGLWRHRAAPWVLATPVLAWFMLTNKVYSPQFDLWLLPLVLITVRTPWPIALFLAGDLLAYAAEFRLFAEQAGALPPSGQGALLIAVSIRVAAMLWIIGESVLLPPPPWIAPAPVSEA